MIQNVFHWQSKKKKTETKTPNESSRFRIWLVWNFYSPVLTYFPNVVFSPLTLFSFHFLSFDLVSIVFDFRCGFFQFSLNEKRFDVKKNQQNFSSTLLFQSIFPLSLFFRVTSLHSLFDGSHLSVIDCEFVVILLNVVRSLPVFTNAVHQCDFVVVIYFLERTKNKKFIIFEFGVHFAELFPLQDIRRASSKSYSNYSFHFIRISDCVFIFATKPQEIRSILVKKKKPLKLDHNCSFPHLWLHISYT